MENQPLNPAGSGKPGGSTGRLRDVHLPLPSGTWPTLRAEFPMTEETWDHMISLLEAMKPGLVKKPGDDNPEAA